MQIAGPRAAPIVTALLAALVPQIAGAQVVLPQGAGRADVRALTGAYNASGQALFKEFAAGSGNIVFSPYSIGTAMAMVLAGALRTGPKLGLSPPSRTRPASMVLAGSRRTSID